MSRTKRFLDKAALVTLILGSVFTGAWAQSPPTITKAFSSATVGLNQSVTLTFTLINPNPATDLTGVSFSDDMPAGLLIANPDSLGGTCDTSVVILSPTNISLAGAVLPANSSCTLVIDVLAMTAGDQVNTTDPITSVEGGTGGTATATVTVVEADLAVTMSHTGTFFRPQSGATYTITVSNVGGADTSALITVDDNLPAGLTATSLQGPNWNCTLSPLQCTRGDTLFAGTSFEDITLTVDVAANAPSSLTNSVTVSGGAESNTANDTASDLTQAIAALGMTAQTSSLTVTAGGSASTVLNVALNGSGLGTISFACSGLPSGALCNFNPASIAASGPVTLSISTTAKSTTLAPFVPPGSFLPIAAFAMTVAVLALSLGFRRFRKALQFRARVMVAGAFACLALLVLVGCGVSMNTPVQHSPGTPAGTSAVTVTASSSNGGATATSTVNLTVQ
ncbi:MAG TPA: hypothetical protein VE783_00500 [Candidatus Limnocylindrales bacterium]|nr:hypothetical protein [Candidatus Limnocylindrales bacterium]